MKSTRRRFLATTSTAASSTFALTFIPSSAFGANDRIRCGAIGVNGKGAVDCAGVADAGAEIAALCDVVDPRNAALPRDGKKTDKSDKAKAGTMHGRFPDAKIHTDFREMIETEDLDAVTISTPDHTHAHATALAMRKGLHVYTQKPLSHSIWEARLLTRIARETGVITAMGNQAHADEPIRRAVELIRAGIIGTVTEVHCWTNRPVWPQGLTERPPSAPVPDGLDWDLWLGPAPEREFSPKYAPFNWRGWWDFGTGALGDMGCHIMDMPFWGLQLSAPTSFRATAEGNTPESGPTKSHVTLHFAKSDHHGPLDFHWYDGGHMPNEDVMNFNLPTEAHMTRRFDLVMVGDRGKIAFGRRRTDWITFPENANPDFSEDAIEKFIPRVEDVAGPAGLKETKGPYAEFLAGIKSGTQPLSAFDYSGPFTESVLLGNLAVRLGHNDREYKWDAKKMEVPGVPEAAPFIRREYRKGWDLS